MYLKFKKTSSLTQVIQYKQNKQFNIQLSASFSTKLTKKVNYERHETRTLLNAAHLSSATRKKIVRFKLELTFAIRASIRHAVSATQVQLVDSHLHTQVPRRKVVETSLIDSRGFDQITPEGTTTTHSRFFSRRFACVDNRLPSYFITLLLSLPPFLLGRLFNNCARDRQVRDEI